MLINIGAKEDGASTHIPRTSSSSFFTDLALHAGLLSNTQNVRRTSDIVREALITREIEKSIIREEITLAGLLRQRELEAEVMSELMRERELALRIGRPEECINGRLLVNRRVGGGLSGLPFQRQPGVTNGFAIKPVINFNGGQKGSLAKPLNSSVAGIKRKFETSTITTAPSVNLSKKSQKEWNCALCLVRATSERALKDHLEGRKHKGKEKALLSSNRTKINNADISVSLPEEIENSIDLAVPTSSMSPILENCPDGNQEGIENAEQHTNDVEKTNDEKQLNDYNFKFCCKLCNFGTTSEASMTAHRNGKKHMALLQENGGGVIAIKTMPDVIQFVNKTKDDAEAKEEKEESLVNADGEEYGVGADQQVNTDQGELATMKVDWRT